LALGCEGQAVVVNDRLAGFQRAIFLDIANLCKSKWPDVSFREKHAHFIYGNWSGASVGRNRLEAFSDGVLAIIITIMVLELKVPHGASLHALTPLAPVLLSYALSFIYIGIYWNNHHHLLHATQSVNAAIMWANLHLLTGWMGENHFAGITIALYGCVLLLSGVAFLLLQKAIIAHQGEGSVLASAIGRDWKGKFSLFAYLIAITLAWFEIPMAGLLYVLVALLWLLPDRRIERVLGKS
jgi:uncharacterized membrane protein